MISELYRSIVPSIYRKKIYDLFLKQVLYFCRNFSGIAKSKLFYIFSFLLEKNEKNEAYILMGKYGLSSYPFRASIDYSKMKIEVFFDEAEQLYFILHNNKRLYFPNIYSSDEVREMYRFLIIEQDKNSPHRYFDDYSIVKDRVLFDIGSAEGIFALDTIDYVKKAYLFECEDYWIKPLKKTFSSWQNKVYIIKQYVSDIDDDKCITLDSFLKGRENEPILIKMDIEGAELSALHGAKNLLQNNPDVVLSVCTYHKENDAKDIDVYLRSIGYKTELTKGYLYWGKALRRGVLRARNNK